MEEFYLTSLLVSTKKKNENLRSKERRTCHICFTRCIIVDNKHNSALSALCHRRFFFREGTGKLKSKIPNPSNLETL